MSADLAQDPNDDLIDDLMNIVQTDDQQKSNNQNENMDDEFENGEFDEFDDDENEEDEILIDEMLEKPIDILEEKDEVNFYTYNKIQIKNIYWRGCQDTILPEGWVQVTHASGMPLFLNRQSRVCTLSRPYFIGQSSARKHDIPIGSIPCLAYKKRKEAIEQQIKEHNLAKQQNKNRYKINNISNENKNNNQPNNEKKCPLTHGDDEKSNQQHQKSTNQQLDDNNTNNEASDLMKPNKKIVVSIQTNEEKAQENILKPEELNDYCKRLFEFDIVKVKKFKTWGDRKKFIKKARQQTQKKFPENAKMLKIQTKTQKGINKELNINMTNKTPLSILYEYTNQVFKTNPRFEIQEKENPKDPFHAVCYINDKICGKGSGNSKKAAKNTAAEAALCVLIPEFKSQPSDTKKNTDEMYTFFDQYNVEHSHIYSLSQKLGAPFPYDILLTCLKYNFAINMSRNRKQFIEEDIKPIKFRNCLYRMKLAQYDVEVNCTKKKEGRQLAAQKILKLMHPHIQTWGSMLRLYGSKINEPLLEDQNKPSEEMEDVEKANDTNNGQKARPNKELLEKLKEEMRKLIKKPQSSDAEPSIDNVVIAAIKNNCNNEKNLIKDSILTIPPLYLGNNEFTLSSDNFLMKSNDDKNLNENMQEEEDGKILFTNIRNDENNKIESLRFDKNISNSSKRKLTENDNDESEEEDETDEEEDDSFNKNHEIRSSDATDEDSDN